MKVINKRNHELLADRAVPAGSFFTRLRGLMFRKSLGEGEGLLLKPCNMVHTFFMRIPLDVVFIDRNNRVLHIVENLQPWNCSPMVSGAKAVLEVPAGVVKRFHLVAGDELYLEI